MDENKIVANGQQRIQQTEYYQRKVGEIRAVIQDKFRAEMAQSNLLKRWILRLKMQREIYRKNQELAPDRALSLRQSSRVSEEVSGNGDKKST